jgi:hypothetical protein
MFGKPVTIAIADAAPRRNERRRKRYAIEGYRAGGHSRFNDRGKTAAPGLGHAGGRTRASVNTSGPTLTAAKPLVIADIGVRIERRPSMKPTAIFPRIGCRGIRNRRSDRLT